MNNSLGDLQLKLEKRLRKVIPPFNVDLHGLITFHCGERETTVEVRNGVKVPEDAERVESHEMMLTLSEAGAS